MLYHDQSLPHQASGTLTYSDHSFFQHRRLRNSTIYGTKKAYAQVWGEVVLDQPFVGAAISVFDQNDKLLVREENSTYVTGAFYLSIPLANQADGAVPSSLKILAEGGTLGNLSFNGKVMLNVPQFDEEKYYKLNAITTLTAQYHERHPEIEHGTAEGTVEAFLEVPSGKN